MMSKGDVKKTAKTASKPYAAVVFLKESDDSNELTAAVPLTWVSSFKQHCMWPGGANTSLYIRRYEQPGPTWKSHAIKFEGSYNTLKDAESNLNNEEQNEQRGRGKRDIRPPSPYSPDEDFYNRGKYAKKKSVNIDPPKPSDVVQNQWDDAYVSEVLQTNRAETAYDAGYYTPRMSDRPTLTDLSTSVSASIAEVPSISTMTPPSAMTSIPTMTPTSKMTSIPAMTPTSAMTSIATVTSSTSVTASSSTTISTAALASALNSAWALSSPTTSAPALSNASFREMSKSPVSSMVSSENCGCQATVINMLGQVLLELQALKQDTRVNRENKCDQFSKIEAMIPCVSLEKLEELENFIKSNRNKKKLYEYFKTIGGNGTRESTLRLLKSCFTNHVAELCSWTGAKDNFKVGNLVLLDVMFCAVRDTNLTYNRKDYEIVVKDWLRHAKQRREREERILF